MGKQVGDEVATCLKQPPAKRVSHIQTKITPRKEGGNGKLGTLQPLPKP